ncbi:MAG: hypothetical protein SPI53_00405 [Erysipelotrichaceae bacterium]|nr:hypothetical protein [Erysipelotrichaceae bacterium]
MNKKYFLLSLIPLVIYILAFAFVYTNNLNPKINIDAFYFMGTFYLMFIYFVGTEKPIFEKYVPFIMVAMSFIFIYVDNTYNYLFGKLGAFVYLPIGFIYYGILIHKQTEEDKNRNIIRIRNRRVKR